MKIRPEKKITDILHDNTTTLGVLLKKVFDYNQLDHNLENYLPSEIVEHVRLGDYQNGKLILLVKSGSWATKLNFMVPDIRAELRKIPAWAGLKNIEIKVAPHLQPPLDTTPVEKPTPLQLTKENIQRLQEAAEGLDDSPESQRLADALKRLGRN